MGSVGVGIAASQAQRFFAVNSAVFQYGRQQDPTVGWLCHVGNVRPVAATAVLCGDQRGVDLDRLDTESVADGVLDVLVDRGVVLVEEPASAAFVLGADILLEERPAQTVGCSFATVASTSARPELAGAETASPGE